MHRPVIDADLTALIEPGQGMLHEVFVVAFRIVLTRMGAAAFGAIDRRIHGHHGLGDEVVEFQRFDQVRVPDQRAVGHADVGDAGEHIVDEL